MNTKIASLWAVCVVGISMVLIPLCTTYAQEDTLLQYEARTPHIEVFYSPTCPHCVAEHAFLDTLEEKYPELVIARYNVFEAKNQDRMRVLAKEYDAEQFLGSVPLTFAGGLFIPGFDTAETTGKAIEEHVLLLLAGSDEQGYVTETALSVPFIGTLDAGAYSLPGLAVILGLLDGFNVCSLGALALIIGLALKLQRRRHILLFGGLFILTTSLVYGGLITMWYKAFSLLTPYMALMNAGIALLALGGGLYFAREYIRMRRTGPVCELSESAFVAKLAERTGHVFKNGAVWAVAGAVLMFAAVVTVVEFPCSAAVPLVFAGLLADAGIVGLSYLGHLALFVFFYMLDEIMVFAIAAYHMKMWLTSGTFTKWAVLGEALVLLGIGMWYLSLVVTA